jgi:HlyD family secretion protein
MNSTTPPTPASTPSPASPPPTSLASRTRPPAKPRRHRRWLPYLGAALLVTLIVLGMRPKPMAVETQVVSVGRLRSTVNEEGKTRIRQRYVVSTPVAGQLRRIDLKAGAELTNTQTVVAVIDPIRPALLDARTRSLAEARRDTAAAQLERARAQHKFARSEFKRMEPLAKDGTVSPQEFEQVEWRETSASRELAAAEAALREAEAELAEFNQPASTNRPPVELRAPVCGRVLKVFEESSRAVAAGTPLLEIGDPTDLEVVIEVLSRDGAMIKPGTPVELEQWGGPEPLQAVIRFVEPAAYTKVSALGVEEQRVLAVADLITPAANRGNLGDNFRVEARIITWQNERALKVPNGAIFRKGSDWHAYVVADGKTHLRRVQVGRASESETEIVDGLKEGESVVLYPGDRIHDGTKVRIVQM